MKKEKIHIGKLVEKAFNSSNLSKSEFAKAIGVHNQNINREFKKQDWSVIKLIDAGKVLNYDFSPLFSIGKNIERKKILLQIEIEDDKINDVLKLIQDKQLYNILKRETDM